MSLLGGLFGLFGDDHVFKLVLECAARAIGACRAVQAVQGCQEFFESV